MKNNKVHSIEDIYNIVVEELNSDISVVLRDAASAGISVLSPALGAVGTSINSFLGQMDAFMINRLLIGLSGGLDQEKQINELYNYVVSNKKRAFIVGNILKQTLISKSPKTCVIYGKALANHIGDKDSDFSRDEVIVCNALVNANDYDLKNFVVIMKECVIDNNIANKIFFDTRNEKIMNMRDVLEDTCSWCAYNRLYKFKPEEYADYVVKGALFIDTHYYVRNPANILLEWIEEVQQIWEYGDN
ncbi:MAG: hypothetical protein E7301_07815 [Butyrivibrio sp.]|nr:hypothetical protein [Butyrivibrio sp.]